MNKLVVCPICEGTGTYLKIKRANGVRVHFGDGTDEYVTCWLCDGFGKVQKEPSPKEIFANPYFL